MDDLIDIGPEAFTNGEVISYKGENYYKACDFQVTGEEGEAGSHCVKRVGHPGVIHEDYHGNMKADHSNTEVELNVEFTEFVRKPFIVEAIEVTAENISELAQLIGKLKEDKNGPYIEVDRNKVPTVFKVTPGYWVTRMGKNIRCYSSRMFSDQFIKATPSIQDFLKLINEGQPEEASSG